MVQVVLLSANGESRTLKTGAITGIPTGAGVAKAVRKTRPAEVVCSYTWKGATLQLWGWKDGKVGTENKHELPPPHAESLFFSDIIVTESTGKDITVEEWKLFYNEAFKGFEDLDEKDEDDSESEADVNGDNYEDAELEEDDIEEEGGDDDSVSDEEEGEVEEEDDAEEDVEEEEEEDEDCYEDGDEAGGGKRRTARRRTGPAADYRRMEMGFRTRLKLPTPVGKRAPRWQTAPELTAEGY
jgi:hypothetical protein